MSVLFNSVSSFTGNGATITNPLTLPAGLAKPVLVVHISTKVSPVGDPVSGVTYNGAAMTKAVIGLDGGAAAQIATDTFYLIGPTTDGAAHNLIVSYTPPGNSIIFAALYYHIDKVGDTLTPVNGSGSTAGNAGLTRTDLEITISNAFFKSLTTMIGSAKNNGAITLTIDANTVQRGTTVVFGNGVSQIHAFMGDHEEAQIGVSDTIGGNITGAVSVANCGIELTEARVRILS